MDVIKTFLDGRVVVKVGDLTREDADAIVNAANWTLLGGGGVDGAIHNAGGPQILAECREIRNTQYPEGLPTGQAVITTGGKLPAKYIIHTVGPIYGENGGRDATLLADCYENSINLAAEHGLQSIAFPSISTGAFRYPKHETAKVVSTTVANLMHAGPPIPAIRLVFFSEPDAQLFIKHCVL